MEKHIVDEKTGISYTLCREYYLPDLEIEDREEVHYGKYFLCLRNCLLGRISERFLTTSSTMLFSNLIMLLVCMVKRVYKPAIVPYRDRTNHQYSLVIMILL